MNFYNQIYFQEQALQYLAITFDIILAAFLFDSIKITKMNVSRNYLTHSN